MRRATRRQMQLLHAALTKTQRAIGDERHRLWASGDACNKEKWDRIGLLTAVQAALLSAKRRRDLPDPWEKEELVMGLSLLVISLGTGAIALSALPVPDLAAKAGLAVGLTYLALALTSGPILVGLRRAASREAAQDREETPNTAEVADQLDVLIAELDGHTDVIADLKIAQHWLRKAQ